jgi:hypothetical protein
MHQQEYFNINVSFKAFAFMQPRTELRALSVKKQLIVCLAVEEHKT